MAEKTLRELKEELRQAIDLGRLCSEPRDIYRSAAEDYIAALEKALEPLDRMAQSRLICNYVERWVNDVLPGPSALYHPDTGKNIGRYVRNMMVDEGYTIVKVES
jgi:hypothetical protein